ncbi:MAG TPA: hypothetical protein VKI44_02925 [Acetobacteraceae bacterium]|nr:hypothetical protein [Acetobacteraceae bacterium]
MDQPNEPSLPAKPSEPDGLDVRFATDLMDLTFDTMRVRERDDPARQASRREAAVTALGAMQASDPVNLMFAAYAVASHHATMECFRRAMLAVNDPDAATRLHRSAVALSRMMADAVQDLASRRRQNSGGKTP